MLETNYNKLFKNFPMGWLHVMFDRIAYLDTTDPDEMQEILFSSCPKIAEKFYGNLNIADTDINNLIFDHIEELFHKEFDHITIVAYHDCRPNDLRGMQLGDIDSCRKIIEELGRPCSHTVFSGFMTFKGMFTNGEGNVYPMYELSYS